VLNKKKIYRYLGEEERPIENRGYTTEEIAKMLKSAMRESKHYYCFCLVQV
jgi:hypothetical protein